MISTFLFQGPPFGGGFGPQLQAYSPFQNYLGNYSNSTLGAYDAAHPIMQGVTSLSGYYRDLVNLAPGATLSRCCPAWARACAVFPTSTARPRDMGFSTPTRTPTA